MESVTKYAAHSSKLRVFPGSSSYKDPDIIELSAASASAWASSHPKRKRAQVVPHEVIEIDEDDDPDALVIIGESNLNHKDKQPVGYNNDWQKQIKNALFNDFNGSSTYCGSGKSPLDIPRSPHSDSLNFDYPDLLNFGYPDGCPYDIYDYKDLIDNDYNYNLAAKFDDFGLPPRVEAMHCLQKSALETTIEKRQKTMIEDEIDPPIEKRQKTMIEDEIDVKYKSFKRFDTVQDHSDHYFTTERIRGTHGVSKSSKNWSKKIQNDWKVLEKDLPETIFVRVYEDRMDLLRAVIIGPAGTPYHDGLFFFDVYFPPNYPQSPPHVHYHSGGLRLNPNLYACGKVCLSLLNTWSGHGCERWNPSKSTMLQVLVSIQALVLNAKPYFNEPGFEKYANTPSGEDQSLAYNEQTFLLSCRTMLYSLRRPLKHFEDFVGGHFRNRGRAILVACRAYMDGAQVGCLVGEGVQDVDEGDKSCSSTFKSSLKQLYEDLVKELTAKGADCNQLVAHKAVMAGASRVLDTTLKL